METRRDWLKLSSGLAGLSLAGCAGMPGESAAPRKLKVVVVGGHVDDPQAGESVALGLLPFHAGRLEDRFVVDDVLPRRDAGDRLSDRVERKVLDLLEADARLSHVELFSRLGPLLAEPFLVFRVAVEAHHVNGHVVFLGGETGERQRLLGVAMIARGIKFVRHKVADHAVLDPFLEVLVEVLENDVANLLDRAAAIGRERCEVILNAGGFADHGRMITSALLLSSDFLDSFQRVEKIGPARFELATSCAQGRRAEPGCATARWLRLYHSSPGDCIPNMVAEMYRGIFCSATRRLCGWPIVAGDGAGTRGSGRGEPPGPGGSACRRASRSLRSGGSSS